MSRALGAFAVLLFVFAFSEIAYCQLGPDTNLDTGINPKETYIRAKETVNVAGGNLNIQIPLVHLSGRDGHDLNLSLTYNSQNWTPVAGFNNQPPNLNSINIAWEYHPSYFGIGSTGWNLNIPVLHASLVSTNPTTPPPTGTTYSYTNCWENFVLVMGDGTKYSFPGAVGDCYKTTTAVYGIATTAVDPYDDELIGYSGGGGAIRGAGAGDGVVLDLTKGYTDNVAVVRFRDGSKIIFPLGTGWQTQTSPPNSGMIASELVDKNGNVISIPTSGNALLTDTLGRQVTYTAGNPYVSNAPGTITYLDSNGNQQTITLNYAQFPTSATTAFTTPAVGTDSGITAVSQGNLRAMLSSIVLPDGLSYTFQYNAYGEIVEITYPTGGYTRYDYQSFPTNFYNWVEQGPSGSADSREVVAKYVCPAATIAAGATTPSGYVGASASDTCPVAEQETTYSRSGGSTTVVDPQGNKTVYSFGLALNILGPETIPPNGALINQPSSPIIFQTSKSIYEGASQLLRTINTSYTTISGQNIYLPASKTTILPSGLQKEVSWSYDLTPQSYNMSIPDRGDTRTYSFWVESDHVIEKIEQGYGQGSPGPVIRDTQYSWLTTNSVNGVNYQELPVYFVDGLQVKKVYYGSGNKVADTTYEYDHYEGGIAASGAVQHGTALNSYSTSYTTRGNVTATTTVASSSGLPLTTRNYEFDDAGNVLKQEDSAGNTTTFSYADSWGNSACAPSSGNAAAYISSVTSPLGEKTQYSWNSCSGTMASTTDTNSQATTFSYDSMDRRVEASYPNGGQTCIQYSDAPNSDCPSTSGSQLPIQIVTTKLINSSKPSTSRITLDGLGREVKNVLSSGYEKDTAYDSDGNVASVTYDGNETQYQYDALGRKVIQTQPDGSGLQWCYDDVTATSAQTNCSANLGSQNVLGSWVDYSDETGRHWQYTYDGLGDLVKVMSPDPGNATAAAPADETDYAYDALGDLTDVDQWNGSYNTTPDVHRSFVYDLLGRLTSASNPETGTTSYSYLNSGSLCSGAPSNVCSRTDADGVTTTYTYDQDGNLTEKSYSDTTPSAFFVYQHGSGSSANNANGRITEEYTGSSSSPYSSQTINNYNSVGQITNETQCVMGTCTGSNELTDTYNLAGDITSWTNGASNPGILLTAKYDNANRLATLTSSWCDSTHPDILFGTTSYGPYGLTATSLGNSSCATNTPITVDRGYDDRGRLTNTTDTGIVMTSSAGSGAVSIEGSEQQTGSNTDATGSFTINGSEQSVVKSNGPGSQDSTGSVSISGSEQTKQTSNAPGSKKSTGSVSISGSEQSKQTSNGPGSQKSTGSVAITGAEQTKSSPTGTGAKASTGWISISGSEQSAYPSGCYTGCPLVYDNGTIYATINGQTFGVPYGEGSTSDSISAALATAINNGSSYVTATSALILTSKTTGASTNYTISAYVVEGNNASLFNGASFSTSTSGSAMTGGVDGTIYDSGTVSLSVNGHADSASFGEGSSSGTIASALVNAVNGDSGAPVTASLSGSTVELTSKNTGSSTNWPISTSVSYDSTDFSSSSFGAGASGLSGGKDGTIYDSGTVNVSVNGHVDSASFGQGSSGSSIVSALAGAINGDSGASVTATASGTTLALSSKTTGSSTNWPISTSVNYDSTDFSSSSYGAGASGMSGGADGTIYDSGTVSLSVNGHADSASFGQGSSASSIASALASAVNGDSGASVTASASGSVVALTSKTTGSATNWPVSTSVSYDSTDFSSSSYAAGASGMSGGQGGTVYDTGTVTITVNGHSDSVEFGNGSTAGSIASALSSAINGDSGSPVTSALSGATISLTTKQAGSNVNYSLSGSNTYDSTNFSQSSFAASPSGSTLTGGASVIYDSGSVTLTIDGTSESASYGQGASNSTIASDLASAFSGDSAITVTASGSTLNIASATSGASTNYSFSSSESYNKTSFSSPSFTVSPSSGVLTGGTTNGVPTPTTLYKFSIPSGGYAPNGNLLQVEDSVTGDWTYTYDPLNRLATAKSTSGYFSGLDLAWAYDNFGNRESQTASGTSNVSLTQQEPLSFTHDNNQADQFTYNADGDVTADLTNSYKYDAEGRICAVQSPTSGVTLYLYNAAGERVAKGSGNFSCDFSSSDLSWNHFALTEWDILDLAGRQMTEYDGSGKWQHTNVFANGQLLTTYSSTGTSMTFALKDWLGTKRVQAKANGEFDMSFASLPYGDQLATGTGATQQFFTGKQRDSESGNDYFGARYYSENDARWLTPDWSASPVGIPYADIENPQSLNLYSYVLNNPLTNRDPDGHVWQCGQQTTSTNASGETVVNANCHDVPAWWDLPGWAITGFANVAYGNPKQGLKEMAYAYGTGLPLASFGAELGAGDLASLGINSLLDGGTIQGLYGTVSVAALQEAASSSGETITVVTNLNSAPVAGRALSVATGEGADALASQASGATRFTAKIPKALIDLMERTGLAARSYTSMGGTSAQEIRFMPQATRFIVKFFK